MIKYQSFMFSLYNRLLNNSARETLICTTFFLLSHIGKGVFPC